jgi:hypothetical protein
MEDVFRSVLNATPTTVRATAQRASDDGKTGEYYAIRPALDGRCVVVNATRCGWKFIRNSKYVHVETLRPLPFMVDGLGNKGLVLFVIVGPARRLRAGGAP